MLLHIIDNRGVLYGYNTKIKTYADNTKFVTYYSFLNLKGHVNKRTYYKKNNTSNSHSRFKSLIRSKSNIIDLAYHNGKIKPWQYFVTLTFNLNIVNSFDYNEVRNSISKFTDNIKHQNKDFEYILVPEFHKDEKKYHIHGLLRGCDNLKLKRALNKAGRGLVKNGCKIYNIKNYNYGFNEISLIKDQSRVSVYMSKYITKTLINLGFKQKYWRSKSLVYPPEELCIMLPEELSKFENTSYLKCIDKESCHIIYLKTE